MKFFKFSAFVLMFSASQPALSQETTELPEGIIAARGEGVVSREIFDASLAGIPEKDRAGVVSSKRRVESRMADLLMSSQLAAAARAEGFDKGLMQYRMQLAADKELAAAWLKHYVDNHPPADYEAMAYETYLLNKDKMITPLTIDVTHLLVSYQNLTPDEAMEQAQKYLDRIQEDPTVFEELIIAHSEDPSASRNKGSFKGVKKGDMVKAFEDAAFALKTPGDFSGLVKSQHGVHIIRLDAINPSAVLEFEKVKQQLMTQKEKEHREQVKVNYLNRFGTMPWTVSEKELQAMLEDYTKGDRQSEDTNLMNTE